MGELWQRLWTNDLWYAVPLVVATSLVYAATRHEAFEFIVPYAVRVMWWIVGFMLIVFGVLWFASLFL